MKSLNEFLDEKAFYSDSDISIRDITVDDCTKYPITDINRYMKMYRKLYNDNTIKCLSYRSKNMLRFSSDYLPDEKLSEIVNDIIEKMNIITK